MKERIDTRGAMVNSINWANGVKEKNEILKSVEKYIEEGTVVCAVEFNKRVNSRIVSKILLLYLLRLRFVLI